MKHYLQRKHKEYVAANDAEPAVLLQDLLNGIEKYKTITGLEGIRHLNVWHKVLKQP